MEEYKGHMASLDLKDKERIMLEEAKNKVESYIYKIKNKLIDDEEAVSKVSTEEQREELRKSAEAGEEWLYDEGYGADLPTMEAKYVELSEPAEKVWFRMAEMIARPEAVKAFKEQLEKVEKVLEKWKESKPQITEEERDEVQAKIDEARKWISEKEAEQAEKQSNEDPAFLSAEVPPQGKTIQKLVTKLSKKPAPKPEKKEEEATNETASNETAAEEEAAEGEEKGEAETETEEAAEEATEGAAEEATEGAADEETVAEGEEAEKAEDEL